MIIDSNFLLFNSIYFNFEITHKEIYIKILHIGYKNRNFLDYRTFYE